MLDRCSSAFYPALTCLLFVLQSVESDDEEGLGLSLRERLAAYNNAGNDNGLSCIIVC